MGAGLHFKWGYTRRIVGLDFDCEGNAYLLAVNAVRSPVRVRIPLSGVATTGEAMWEGGRRVSLAGGALEDEFGPQAVHVYRFVCR